jgi:hypothetical protein
MGDWIRETIKKSFYSKRSSVILQLLCAHMGESENFFWQYWADISYLEFESLCNIIINITPIVLKSHYFEFQGLAQFVSSDNFLWTFSYKCDIPSFKRDWEREREKERQSTKNFLNCCWWMATVKKVYLKYFLQTNICAWIL